MTNKKKNSQRAIQGGARDNLCKNPLEVEGWAGINLLLTTQEEQLWVYTRSKWAGHKERGQVEKLLEQEEPTIPAAPFLNKQHFQQKVLGT